MLRTCYAQRTHSERPCGPLGPTYRPDTHIATHQDTQSVTQTDTQSTTQRDTQTHLHAQQWPIQPTRADPALAPVLESQARRPSATYSRDIEH